MLALSVFPTSLFHRMVGKWNAIAGRKNQLTSNQTIQAFLNVYEKRRKALHALWYPEENHFPAPSPIVRRRTENSQIPDETINDNINEYRNNHPRKGRTSRT